MPDLFKEIIPSIMTGKTKVITANNEKDYVPFVVNKALSFHYDCIMWVNEMNKNPSLGAAVQYDYLFHSIRKRSRAFKKWLKNTESEEIGVIREYYKYSSERAKEVLPLLSKENIIELKKRLDKGGLQKK
jgi:hypothetical protein